MNTKPSKVLETRGCSHTDHNPDKSPVSAIGQKVREHQGWPREEKKYALVTLVGESCLLTGVGTLSMSAFAF